MKLYRTRTREEYYWLMQELEDEGYKWSQKHDPTELNIWPWFKDKTVIINNDGGILTYMHRFNYEEKYPNDPIIEVSELMEADPLVTKIEERNKKSYQEQLKELTEPLDLINHHKEICKKLNELYADKNHDYGHSFGETYEKLGAISAVTRISDKTNRMVSLVTKDEQRVDDEKLIDTAYDLANYAIMFAMELEREEE